jgi:ABC-type glycerol-3-phosphate transport system substrate-binding protein
VVNKVRLAALIAASLLLLAGCGGDSESDSGNAAPGATSRASSAASPAASGPTATLSPRNGPPGTEVTISGSGWPAAATVTVVGESASGAPYSTVTTNEQGGFTVQFRLEKQPNGADLQIGRFNLIARSGTTDVVLPFQVDSRRPVQGPGPGGG